MPEPDVEQPPRDRQENEPERDGGPGAARLSLLG
jgi:hypothetical protein